MTAQQQETLTKYLKLIGYLTVSNGLGYLLATYIANDPMLTAIFAPSINLIIYLLQKEVSEEGVVKAAFNK